MTFRFVDEVIGNYQIGLDALEPDTNLYTTLLLQHTGVFYADANRFGNRDDCSDRFNAFLSLAKAENSSIAITPEYSCPWNTIRWILQSSDNHPAVSKLWALGCESITPAELRAIREQYQSDNILIHFDDTALDRGVNTLLNPLCYVFNVRNPQSGEHKLVILVQFKTEHMGVWTTDLEQIQYIPGTEIYVLRNGQGSIALFTLICSETENFQISPDFKRELDERWDNNSFIILNIQMNPNPSALFFRTFRNGIMNYANKDIITVNWSSVSTRPTGQLFINYSKSSVMYGSSDMEFADEKKFTDNHQMGLYYTNRRPRRHVYFLNGKQDVFLIAHHKPISGGVNPAMLKRTGPIGRKNFSWDINSDSFIASPSMDDGFATFLNQFNPTSSMLRNPDVPFIDKERLVNLSLGLIKVKPPDRIWYTIDKLHSFFLEDDEVIRRLTFVQDVEGDAYRRECIAAIETINSVIIPRADLFPGNHNVFAGHCNELTFTGSDSNKYRFNLVTEDGAHKATVAYIGLNTLATAETTLKNLRELFDEEDQSRKRVMVWYKSDIHTIVPVSDVRKPTASDDSKSKPNSISRQP